MKVAISELSVDEAIQLRSRWIDEETVRRYVEALSVGSEFPPIVAFRSDGRLWVADGFHRLAAYQFVGLAEIDVEIREGARQAAQVHAAIANVTNGKPMSREQKKEAGKRLLRLTNWSDREIARKLAVTHPTVGNWRESLSGKNLPDTTRQVEVIRGGATYQMDVSGIGKQAEEATAGHQDDSWPEVEGSSQLPDSIRLILGDFADIAPTLPSESIGVIITDPPYGKEYLHLYELLAREAARLLRPGGSLLAMTGQSYLPEILDLMTPHLNYHWMISYDTPGGQSPQLWQRKVNSFWKPVLWFVKGDYEGAWRGDKIKSDVNDNDKRFSSWGQSESGIGRLVREFAFKGTVLDPFVGGGTVGAICYRLRKPFIGIDRNMAAIRTSRQRILLEIQRAESERGTNGLA